MEVNIKRLHKDAKLPSYAHPGDIGMDVYALEAAEIKPGERTLFQLGFAMEFPEGYGGFMKDKGSTSLKMGLHVSMLKS